MDLGPRRASLVRSRIAALIQPSAGWIVGVRIKDLLAKKSSVVHTNSSPARNAFASSVLGEFSNSTAFALSITRPRCSKTISPPDPARFAEIVRGHDDLDAARGNSHDDIFDRLGRCRVEA